MRGPSPHTVGCSNFLSPPACGEVREEGVDQGAREAAGRAPGHRHHGVDRVVDDAPRAVGGVPLEMVIWTVGGYKWQRCGRRPSRVENTFGSFEGSLLNKR